MHAHATCRYVQDYVPEDPKTHQGHDLNRMPMMDLYKAYGLNDDTIGAMPGKWHAGRTTFHGAEQSWDVAECVGKDAR
eukprot:117132-Chlamydomonas_euryale.AAC.17